MAEYAGLEIRIGGDTTKLNSALKASTKSAAELQSRIRQITRAMQFDGTDLKNVETRIKITGDRMQSLQSKAQLMQKAMKQLGDSVVGIDGRTVRQVAEETDNLSLSAKQADERYNKLTGSLATVYEAWNRLSRSEGRQFAMDELGIDAKTADYLMRASTSLRDFRVELNNINEARRSGLDVTHDIITPEQLATLQKFKELNFHAMFENGLDLDEVVKQAHSLGIAISDDAVANVRKLQDTFKEAAQEKREFDKALQFEQIGTDLQRINSETESLSQTMRWLDDSVVAAAKSPWFQETEDQIHRVDAALETVDKDLERTEAAMKVDPSNIQLAARYMDDLQQKVSLSEEKSKLLVTQLGHIETEKVKDAVKSHGDLAKWIEDSAENARVAKKELSEQQAVVQNLDDAVKGASQSLATMKRDLTLVEMSDNVQSLAKKMEKLTKAEADLAREQKVLTDNEADFAKQKQGFEEKTKDAESYKKQLDALEKEYKELGDAYRAVYDDPSVDYDSKLGMYDRLNELETEIPKLSHAFNEAKASAADFEKDMRAAEKRLKTSKSSVEQAEDKVSDLKDAIDKLKETKEVKLFENPGEEIAKEEAALEELRVTLGEAMVEEKRRQATYSSAAAENSLAKEAKAYDEVEQQIEEMRVKMLEAQDAMSSESGHLLNPSTIKSLGMTLSATLTPAIAGIGRGMVDASTDIDSAYRDMRKTVDGTEEQFESLRRKALEFSTTHVTSADQILQIEAVGGELGIATESLETFAEVISNLDVATNLDVEGAADALGHLANILHLTEEDYVGFSDALVRLGNNGASTETEIANIAERIGSMASIVGMSGSDVLAFASSIASTGQNAEAAGTAISKTLSFMETAVSAAGGTMDTSFEAINAAVEEGGNKLTVFASLAGMTADEFSESWATNSKEMASELNEQLDSAKDSLQMIADVAHMSADEFANMWESDPTEAVKAFINGLNDIEGAGGSADKVLQDLGITSVRQKQAIEGLMQTISGLDDNLKMSEDAWKGISDKWGQAGDAANEAAKKAEGFSGQLQIMKNMWHNALAELGEGAAPWMQRFTGILGSLTDAFSNLSTGAKETIVALGGIAFATGPVLTLVSTLMTSSENIHAWARNNVSGLAIVQDAYKRFGNEGVKALTGVNYTMASTKLVVKSLGVAILKSLAVGAAIAGVVALGIALKNLYDQYQDHIAATSGLKNAIDGIGVASKDSARYAAETERTLGDLVKESGDYESRLADLAHTIEESNGQYGTFAGTLGYYGDVVRELADKEGRTEEESAKLSAALQGINEACGTTYAIDEYGRIIDTQTGKVQDNTEAIYDNINARKYQAMLDYYADDYAKATENWAKAQDRVNELQEEYLRLTSDEGHEAYIEDYMANHLNDRSQAEMVYQAAVRQTSEALEDSRTELAETESAMGKLEGKMDSARQELDKANEAIDAATAAEEEYAMRSDTVIADVTGNMKRLSDAMGGLGNDDAGFNAIVDGLEAIYVRADELDGVDMSALIEGYDSVSGSMEKVIQTLESGGVHMDTWNAALEQAPEAAEVMGSLTAAAFQSMYDSAGQDINATMTLIAGLDVVQVGDKTFYVGDNGSITDSQGKVYDIKSDLAEIPNEVITTYYIDDADAQKKALDTKEKLSSVDKQKATPKIVAKDEATKVTDSVKSEFGKLDKTSASPTVNVRDFASSVLSAIGRNITNLNGRIATVTVNTVEKTTKQATGGMNSRPVIPRHATGYIATGPTLTNQGWVGEDGVEAVVNWATGGVVMPLTNKKYMLPIADAIADGMSRRGGDVGSTTTITLNVSCDGGPEETANAIVRALRANRF